MVRGALSIALVVAISGCTSTSPVKETTAANYDHAIGVVDSTCLAIQQNHLLQGEALTVVSFDEPQRVVQAFVDASASNGCAVSDERKAANEQTGFTYYSLIGLPKGFTSGAAFVSTFDAARLPEMDVNANGEFEVVSQCMTENSMRVMVTENGSMPVWGTEYFLGEGQTATCL